MLRPGIMASKLIPVPMGIPDEDMPDEPGAASHEPLVLYLGSLARVRHLEMVVQAFSRVHKRLPGSRLAIVGDGDVPEDRASLEREVHRLQLADAVVFTGHLPRLQALHWIRRAAVCLSPIYPNSVLRVSSPTKLIEYMAFSKPVVANDQPPEQAAIMAATNAGICTPWDADAFANAILELLADPARCSRAGRDGRAWVARFRLYSQIARDVWPHYEALVQPEARISARP
jgi:glycosyltransferase involved in cell wall biosynthesis